MARIYDPRTGQITEVDSGAGMPPPPPASSGLLRRLVGDPLVTAAKSVVGLGEAAVGLADIPTLGYAGKAAEGLGVRFKDTNQILSDLYSTQHQQAQREVDEAQGFTGTVGAALSNPVWTLHKAAEMLPQIAAGGAAGRAAMGGAKAAQAARAAGGEAGAIAHAVKAGAVGEGILTAAANTEQLRQQTEDGTLTAGQVATQVAAGVGTGAIAFGFGKLATRAGITDVDVLAAGGAARRLTPAPTAGGVVSRVAKGVASEGTEELLQSGQEQMWQNVATDRPVMEGVDKAAGLGVVLGGVMGGTVAGRIQNNKVADAAAALDILSRPAENGDTTQHTLALKAVADLVGHFDPTRREAMAQWRIDQMENVNKGLAVDYALVPEFAPESVLRGTAESVLAAAQRRRQGVPQVTDDFGNVVQEATLPRAPTRQEAAAQAQLQQALDANDMEMLQQLQGRLAIPAFQSRPAPPATPAPPAGAPPAVVPPAVVPAVTKPPAAGAAAPAPLDNVEATLKSLAKADDATLRGIVASEAQKQAPNQAVIDEATRILMARATEAPPLKVQDISKQMKAHGMAGRTKAAGEFITAINAGDTAAAEAIVTAIEHGINPSSKAAPGQQAFAGVLRSYLPAAQGTAHAPQSATQVSQGTQPQPAAVTPDAQAAGVAGQAATEGTAAAQPAQEVAQVGPRFAPGQRWTKGSMEYTVESVSADGKLAVMRQGRDTFTAHLDAELANGWTLADQPAGVTPNAVQESSAASDDARPAPADGPAVGDGNAQGQTAPAETGHAASGKTKGKGKGKGKGAQVAPPLPPPPTLTGLLATANTAPVEPPAGPPKLPTGKATGLHNPHTAAKALKALGQPAIEFAREAWELRREMEARRVGVPAEGFYAHAWDELSTVAQAIWASSEFQSDAYVEAKQADHATRAADEAAKVGSKVDAARRGADERVKREADMAALAEATLRHYKMAAGEARTQLGQQVVEEYARLMRKKPADVTIRDVQQALFTDIAEHVRLQQPAAREGRRNPVRDALENASGQPGGVDMLLDLIHQGEMSLHPQLVGMAKLLKDIGTTGITIEYIPEARLSESGQTKRGNYNARTNTIEIYKGGEQAHTILHEVAHALTVHALAQAQREQAAGKQTQQVKALAQLQELFEFAKPALEAAPETQYATKSVAEFVAEAVSNPKVQAALRTLAVPSTLTAGKPWYKAAFDGFIEGVRKLLKLSPKAHDGLSAALDLTGRFLTPNTEVAPLQDPEGGAYDALVTPAAAVALPFRAAKAYLKSFDRMMDSAPVVGLKEKARKAYAYLASSKHLQHTIKHSPDLKALARHFQSWFDADTAKTVAMKMVGDEASAHGRAVELALAKVKSAHRLKAQQTLGWLFPEAARLGIDLSKNYAQNLVTQPKLDPALKDDIDRLHAEYVRFRSNPQTKELARLGHVGVQVHRKQYGMQAATFALSILRSHRTGPTEQAAAYLINTFEAKLDILQDASKLTNSDPAMHFDALASTLDVQLRALFKEAERGLHADTSIWDDLQVVKQMYESAWANPYMHLGRHGMYMVAFSVKDTGPATVARLQALLGPHNKAMGPFLGKEDHVFLRVESLYEMQEIYAKIKAEPNLVKVNDKGESTLLAGPISDATSLDNAFGLSKLARALRERMRDKYDRLAAAAGGRNPEVKAAMDAAIHALNETLIDMLEVNSAQKAKQRRVGVPGYETDYLRNFAKRSEWAASVISNQYAADKFSDAFLEMQHAINALNRTDPMAAAKGQELYDELAIRHANALNPVDSPIIDRVRALGYNFYLALSPAFVLTNLMQPYHLTLPLLGARFGFVKTAKVMAQSSWDALQIGYATAASGIKEGGGRGLLDAKVDLSKAQLTADERRFVEHILRLGIVDATASHELGRMSQGDSSALATAAKTMALLSHYSEVNNRLTAGLTAFRLSKGDFDARTKYAVDAIEKTQFNYSDHNTARALGRHGFLGKVTPLMTAFQQYAFQTMEHYVRLVNDGYINQYVPPAERQEARRALLGTLATTGLIAGTMGLPFASILFAVANALGAGGDDNEDARARYRAWLESVFGKDMAELVARGGFRAVGIDMSARAGHQDLIPGTRFLADRRNWEDKMKDQTVTMLGPALNAGIDIFTGALHVADGDVVKGVESALPLAVRGLYKTGVMAANERGYTNKAGNEVPVPVTGWDMTVQGFGFTPAKKAEQSEASFYHQGQQALTKHERAKLRREYVAAIESGEGLEAAQTQAAAFNAKHPDDPVTGVREALAGRARGRAMAEISGTGILESNRKYFPRLEKFSWANTGIGE